MDYEREPVGRKFFKSGKRLPEEEKIEELKYAVGTKVEISKPLLTFCQEGDFGRSSALRGGCGLDR